MTDIQEIKGNLLKNHDAIRQKLVDIARDKKIDCYSNFFAPYGLDMNDPSHRVAASECLDRIGLEERQAGRPMLTSLLVFKNDMSNPGEGFYRLAEKLGYAVRDKMEFFTTQVAETHKYHSREIT